MIDSTGYAPFVAGAWRDGAQRRTLHAPYDGVAFGETSDATARDVEDALVGAVAARPACAALPSSERAAVLRHVAARLGEARSVLARHICVAVGKPIVEAEAEVDRATRTFQLAAEALSAPVGETLELAGNGRPRAAVVRRFPVGVVVAIAPFNFPLNLVAHKLAPAIAAGCPVLLKPPPQAPLPSLALAQFLSETSWPAEALSVLPCDPALAETLVTDPRPQLVSFTGSQAVGWRLRAIAGSKRVVLELGGNAAAYVDGSADLDAAASALVASAFAYAGQKCISLQRLFVADEIYGNFVGKCLAAATKITVGDPSDRGTLCGPVIDDRAQLRIEEWVAEAERAGAEPLLPMRVERPRLLTPGIYRNVPNSVRLAREEAFAPTLNVASAPSPAAAFSAMNDSDYGLQAAVWTERQEVVQAAFEQLEVGGVIVNDAPSFRDDAMPYGGVKRSGLGREGVRSAITELTEPRLLVMPPPLRYK